MFKKVSESTGKAMRRQKAYYDQKVMGKDIVEGDKVRYVNFVDQEGLDKSFQLKYQNKVLTVRKKLSDVNYELVGDDGKTFATHYNHLKKVFVRDDGEETENQPVRRSNRNRRVPARLRDFDLQADERSLD